MEDIVAIKRLPNFMMIHPEKGKDIIKPIGSAKRTIPKEVSDSPKLFWMVGILDAQLAKHNPARKKMAATAIL